MIQLWDNYKAESPMCYSSYCPNIVLAEAVFCLLSENRFFYFTFFFFFLFPVLADAAVRLMISSQQTLVTVVTVTVGAEPEESPLFQARVGVRHQTY